MQIPVAQLEEHLAKREEGAVTAKLGDFIVSDDATLLTVHDSPLSQSHFALDEHANHALARYLKVPQSYFDALTPDFRAVLLRYEFDRRKDVDTVVESIDHEIVAVHQPSQIMLPLKEVGAVVTRVLDPEDTVRRLITDGSRFHLDATTSDHVVGWVEMTDDVSVGDITEGGFRVLAYPFQSKPPSVSTYLERLVCSNGQTSEEKLGQITLKGRTVPEVLAEMELAANLVLEQLDTKLGDYAKTREVPVPGSPQAFAAQLAREANVSRKVLDAVLDIVNQLPEPVTVWDVQNAFTAVANQVETYGTMTRLQALGGSLSFETERMIQRCGSCERLL